MAEEPARDAFGLPQPPAPWSPKLGVTGGLDYASAYYFRGYLQADRGFILQPYLSAFATCHCSDEWIVRPYVSFFHSGHDDGNPMKDMTDAMLGATASWKGLVVDGQYGWYTTSPTQRGDVHELGVRASFDVWNCWREGDEPACFTLRPYAGLYVEASDEAGSEDAYLELGLDPAWRFDVCGTKVGLALPLALGLSADDYYFDDLGDSETLGYFSAGVTASVALPAPPLRPMVR